MASPTAPVVDDTGITAPSYASILDYLKTQYRSIFGASIYLESDSQDGQFLAIITLAIHESNSAAVAVYNSFSPASAQGRSLSNNVKLNGITRLVATNSTADVNVVGSNGTVITNGVVEDTNGRKWNLPASVVIPGAGTITVTATCQEVGAIAAAAAAINKISTPVFGWQSVTNPQDAVLGQPVETDAALRVRQALSVAVPSATIFEGVIGSVANIPGVTRIKGVENDSDVTDGNGIESHTIAVVVEGGDSQTIANTIADKKTPGTGTHGNLAYDIIDSTGSHHIIRFHRPTEVVIKVNMTIQPLSGYSTPILAEIKQALADYFNTLGIGVSVNYFDVLIPAKLDNNAHGDTYKITAITIAKNAGGFGTADIALLYDEVATGNIANMNITVL